MSILILWHGACFIWRTIAGFRRTHVAVGLSLVSNAFSIPLWLQEVCSKHNLVKIYRKIEFAVEVCRMVNKCGHGFPY
jgi:hypothetical protein